jgi:hypothetical protein
MTHYCKETSSVNYYSKHIWYGTMDSPNYFSLEIGNTYHTKWELIMERNKGIHTKLSRDFRCLRRIIIGFSPFLDLLIIKGISLFNYQQRKLLIPSPTPFPNKLKKWSTDLLKLLFFSNTILVVNKYLLSLLQNMPLQMLHHRRCVSNRRWQSITTVPFEIVIIMNITTGS